MSSVYGSSDDGNYDDEEEKIEFNSDDYEDAKCVVCSLDSICLHCHNCHKSFCHKHAPINVTLFKKRFVCVRHFANFKRYSKNGRRMPTLQNICSFRLALHAWKEFGRTSNTWDESIGFDKYYNQVDEKLSNWEGQTAGVLNIAQELFDNQPPKLKKIINRAVIRVGIELYFYEGDWFRNMVDGAYNCVSFHGQFSLDSVRWTHQLKFDSSSDAPEEDYDYVRQYDQYLGF